MITNRCAQQFRHFIRQSFTVPIPDCIEKRLPVLHLSTVLKPSADCCLKNLFYLFIWYHKCGFFHAAFPVLFRIFPETDDPSKTLQVPFPTWNMHDQSSIHLPCDFRIFSFQQIRNQSTFINIVVFIFSDFFKIRNSKRKLQMSHTNTSLFFFTLKNQMHIRVTLK